MMKLRRIDTSAANRYYELNNGWNGSAVYEGQGSNWSGRPLKAKTKMKVVTIDHDSNQNGYGETEILVPQDMVTLGYRGNLFEVLNPDEHDIKLMPIYQAITEGCYNGGTEIQENLMDTLLSIYPEIDHPPKGLTSRFVWHFTNFLNQYTAEIGMISGTDNNCAFWLFYLSNCYCTYNGLRISQKEAGVPSLKIELYDYKNGIRFNTNEPQYRIRPMKAHECKSPLARYVLSGHFKNF